MLVKNKHFTILTVQITFAQTTKENNMELITIGLVIICITAATMFAGIKVDDNNTRKMQMLMNAHRNKIMKSELSHSYRTTVPQVPVQLDEQIKGTHLKIC